MMKVATLLGLPEGIEIDHIEITETRLVVSVVSTNPQSCCPLCSQLSSHIHSYYHRSLKDAPCVGRQLQLSLTVRKFLCQNLYCSRKVFTERLPELVEPWARMTTRLREQIASIGLATSGKAGVRLGDRLGIETSRNTTLRRIMDVPDEARASVVYLGLDDFAFRRGYRFGTILVDLESHRPIDVLPDRRAETSAAWMRDNPEIAVVSRDRGGEYASAAREGAPQAIQCADRFHMVKNLTEAFQVLLARCQAEILAEKKQNESGSDEPNKPIITIEEWRPPEPAHVEKVRLARRAGRYARYQHVVELSKQGLSTKEIAGRLGMSDRTVRDWLKHGTFPEAQKRRKRQSAFDVFAPYILKRWREGERNGLALWREIKALGYTGSDRSVYRHLATLKRVEVKASVNVERIQKFSTNTAIWLFMRHPKKLDEIEREDLATFCQASPTLKRAYTLAQDFLSMVHKREGQRLEAWLAQATESGITELQSFAAGIEKDKEAVKAGLTWSINNGMVEGHVTKLKLIKRQGYGRAGFPLLRKRVLHAV
jgi:transposase